MSRLLRRAWLIFAVSFMAMLLVIVPQAIYYMATGRGKEPVPLWVGVWLYTEAAGLLVLAMLFAIVERKSLKELIVSAWRDE